MLKVLTTRALVAPLAIIAILARSLQVELPSVLFALLVVTPRYQGRNSVSCVLLALVHVTREVHPEIIVSLAVLALTRTLVAPTARCVLLVSSPLLRSIIAALSAPSGAILIVGALIALCVVQDFMPPLLPLSVVLDLVQVLIHIFIYIYIPVKRIYQPIYAYCMYVFLI
jgi:hypothetical protein